MQLQINIPDLLILFHALTSTPISYERFRTPFTMTYEPPCMGHEKQEFQEQEQDFPNFNTYGIQKHFFSELT